MGQLTSFFAGCISTDSNNVSTSVDEDLVMLQYIEAHRKHEQ
jgi:hypothetical protein